MITPRAVIKEQQGVKSLIDDIMGERGRIIILDFGKSQTAKQ